MGLLDEIKATAQRGKNQCKFGALLDSLDKADRAEVEQALQDSSISVLAIVTVLHSHGYITSKTNLRDHRKGLCCCVAK